MSLKLRYGPMFSGKSTSVQTEIRRYQAVGWPVFVVTHTLDTRYSATPMIVNHDQHKMPALSGTALMDFLTDASYRASKLVVIEEAQFFPDLVAFVKQVVDVDKKHCIVVGLDGDSERRPIGHVLDLVPLADEACKFNALCRRCGDGTEAPFTYAHAAEAEAATAAGNVCVGADDRYTPLCRRHWLEATGTVAKNTVDRARSISITHHGC